MNIIISTVYREDGLVHKTIESIRSEIPPEMEITLMAGGNNYDYLKDYTEGFNKITDLYEVEKNLIDIHKAAYGYFRCLTYNRNEPVLIVEDDAIFEKGWYEKLKYFSENFKDEKRIISLITPLSNSVPKPDINVPSIQQMQYLANVTPGEPGNEPHATVVTWMNSSTVLFTPKLLNSTLPEFVFRYSVQGNAMYDLAMGYFFLRMNVPIYITVPSLLKPLGEHPSAIGHPEKRHHDNYSDWDWKRHYFK